MIIYIKMVKFISEIGINHNGSMDICKKMILLSKVAGADYVKIQKRNPDVCVPEDQKNKMRKTPWGTMTYLEYKKRIEFDEEQIKELVDYCKEIDIEFFASVWDLDSVKLMSKYTKIAKLGSASINDIELCKATRQAFDFVIISTGMSTEEEIEAAVEASKPDVIMHTNSTYPCPPEDLNLNYIKYLQEKWGNQAEIGYSGHESSVSPSLLAYSLGANYIERHITLDRSMWGTDQAASLSKDGMLSLVRILRKAPLIMGNGIKKISVEEGKMLQKFKYWI